VELRALLTTLDAALSALTGWNRRKAIPSRSEGRAAPAVELRALLTTLKQRSSADWLEPQGGSQQSERTASQWNYERC
jgi:hypothetical protein